MSQVNTGLLSMKVCASTSLRIQLPNNHSSLHPPVSRKTHTLDDLYGVINEVENAQAEAAAMVVAQWG